MEEAQARAQRDQAARNAENDRLKVWIPNEDWWA